MNGRCWREIALLIAVIVTIVVYQAVWQLELLPPILLMAS